MNTFSKSNLRVQNLKESLRAKEELDVMCEMGDEGELVVCVSLLFDYFYCPESGTFNTLFADARTGGALVSNPARRRRYPALTHLHTLQVATLP